MFTVSFFYVLKPATYIKLNSPKQLYDNQHDLEIFLICHLKDFSENIDSKKIRFLFKLKNK